MSRPRTNRKDRWYLPKTHRYHFLGYCYECNGKVYVYLPNHVRKCLNMPFVADSKALSLKKLEQLIAQGNISKQRTTGDLWHEYQKVVLSTKEKSNQYLVKYAWNTYMDADIPLSDINKIREHIAKEGKTINSSPSTVRVTLRTVKRVFEYAVSEGYIDRNPITSQMLPKVKAVRHEAMTDWEMQRLLDYYKDHKPRHYHCVLFIYHTGVRISEALGLLWSDVKSDHILIRGKGGYLRKIPLELLGEMKLFFKAKGTGRVFNIARQTMQANYIIARNKLGIKATGLFHAIRRWRENKWMNSNINIKTVAYLLGHTTQIQSQHYVSESTVNDIIDAFNVKRM